MGILRFLEREPSQQTNDEQTQHASLDLTARRESERRKYVDLFAENPKYGRSSHAKGAHRKIRSLNIQSVCDVGCGRGHFCLWMAKQGCPKVYGIDFASTPTGDGVIWSNANAWDLPLPDKSVEYVTAFDMMEHLLGEDIERTLAEFARVATRGFIFSICYRPSIFTGPNGETLHPTVRPESWWIEQISRCAEVEKLKRRYLLCALRNEEPGG